MASVDVRLLEPVVAPTALCMERAAVPSDDGWSGVQLQRRKKLSANLLETADTEAPVEASCDEASSNATASSNHKLISCSTSYERGHDREDQFDGGALMPNGLLARLVVFPLKVRPEPASCACMRTTPYQKFKVLVPDCLQELADLLSSNQLELMAAFIQVADTTRHHLQQPQQHVCPNEQLGYQQQQQQTPQQQKSCPLQLIYHQQHNQGAQTQEQQQEGQQQKLQEPAASQPWQQELENAAPQAPHCSLPVSCISEFLQNLSLPGWTPAHVAYATQQISWHTNLVQFRRTDTSGGGLQPYHSNSRSNLGDRSGAATGPQQELCSLEAQGVSACTGTSPPSLHASTQDQQSHKQQDAPMEQLKQQQRDQQDQQQFQEAQVGPQQQQQQDQHQQLGVAQLEQEQHQPQQQQQGEKEEAQQVQHLEAGYKPAREAPAGDNRLSGPAPRAGSQQPKDLIYAELAAAIVAAAETEATAAAGKLPREAVQLLADLAMVIQQEQGEEPEEESQQQQGEEREAESQQQQQEEEPMGESQQQQQQQQGEEREAESQQQQQEEEPMGESQQLQQQQQGEEREAESQQQQQEEEPMGESQQQQQQQQGEEREAQSQQQQQEEEPMGESQQQKQQEKDPREGIQWQQQWRYHQPDHHHHQNQKHDHQQQGTRRELAAAVWGFVQALESQVAVNDVRVVAWVAALIQQQLAEAAVGELLVAAAAEYQGHHLASSALAAPLPAAAEEEEETKEAAGGQSCGGPYPESDARLPAVSGGLGGEGATQGIPDAAAAAAVTKPSGGGAATDAPDTVGTAADGGSWGKALLAASMFTVEPAHLQQLLQQVGMACSEALREQQQQQQQEQQEEPQGASNPQQQQHSEWDLLLGPASASAPLPAVGLRPSRRFISLSLSMGSSGTGSPKVDGGGFYGKLLLRQSSGWSETQQLTSSPWAGARNGPFVSLSYPAVAVGVGDILRVSSRGDWPSSSSSPLVRRSSQQGSVLRWGSGNLGASWGKGLAGSSSPCREGGGAGAWISAELGKCKLEGSFKRESGLMRESSIVREGSMKRYGSGGSPLQLLGGLAGATDWLIGPHFGNEEA